MFRLLVLPLLLLLVALALAAPALAQRITATIRGTVSDPTAAVDRAAPRSRSRTRRRVSRAAETNASGSYAFADLPVGSYTVDVEFAGFKSAVTKRGPAQRRRRARRSRLKLETGAITESVSVEVPAVSVKTIGGDVSGLITGAQVRELPLNGRNFLQLALLMPGVSAPDSVNSRTRGCWAAPTSR